MSIAQQEFTNAGRAMLGRAQAGEVLHISKIVVGSGMADVPDDLWPLTALIAHEMDVAISTTRDFGNGTLLVEGNFRSEDAPHAFDLRELGVMAHIGAESDSLYSVANVFADTPDHIDPAAPTIQAFKIKLIIDRIPSGSLSITIGPTEAITGENIGSDTDGVGPYKEAVGNIFRFKRFTGGEGIDVTQDVDEELITIQARNLQADLDLYVPEDNPNAPNPDVAFPTIQEAHDYLLQYHIPSSRVATINVYSGHFTQLVPINFTHPDAAQIRVLGLDIAAKTVSGNITRAGTLPNLDITIPIPSGTAGISVNDVVYLYDAPHAQLESAGYVTQVLGTSIKVRMRIANVLPPASIAALGSTKLIHFPTQFASSTSGVVFNCPNGIKLIKGFGLRSTLAHTGQAFGLQGVLSSIEHCACVNYQVGFGVSGVAYFTPVLAANDCTVGIEVGPSGTVYLQAPNPVGGYARFTWSGNVTYGLWAVGGSYVSGASGSATYACSNDGTGIRSDTRGFCGVSSNTAAGGYVVGYNDVGVQAIMLGIVLASNSVTSAIALNVTWDLNSSNGGQIQIVHNSTLGGNYSPALGVLGPSGGFNSMAL